jgi:hypothetical protein
LDYGFTDFVGNVGVALILGSYLMLQLGRLDPKGLAYSAVNATGATLVTISLLYDFNLSAFVVEVFWGAISLLGVVRNLRARA